MNTILRWFQTDEQKSIGFNNDLSAIVSIDVMTEAEKNTERMSFYTNWRYIDYA